MRTYRAVIVGCGGRTTRIDAPVVEGMWPTPHAHAAGYVACDRTELLAGADVREAGLAALAENYGVPDERLYSDYRELIDREKPDIISIGTQPEQRAQVAIYAAEHGVKAIYAEKAMTSSMDEANAMVEAVERNGVAFNMGTNRRWDPAFIKMREIIAGGEVGELGAVINYYINPLYNAGSHWLDVMQFMNGDVPAVSVSGHITEGAEMIDGDIVGEDPWGHGTVRFENGVLGYALITPRKYEQEIICERGIFTVYRNMGKLEFRPADPADERGRFMFSWGEFPTYEPASTTLRIIEDLVCSMDTGEPTQGGVRVARANTEMIIGLIESGLRGGASVELPLKGSRLRLQRSFDPTGDDFKPNNQGARGVREASFRG